ncbi:hypothetical protein [Kineosporia sp. NBRC 101731]|uniref:hypothetical protein n=1 Tax=Kineosporia sp. NBRC 101731 TaxID=3032199 RepID=UPI00249FA342|nr:hypothetical protein [Kineosporia sp. NBRC 101731]GLY32091.1 hypothetical protein Kisp02_54560 [Kineosporia sp. NBRC 101731]
MPAVPRILRAVPGPEIIALDDPFPVIAILHWQSLRTCQPAHAWALAHSDHPTRGRAVLTHWATHNGTHTDWIRRADIVQPGGTIVATRRMEWEDPPRLDPVTLPAPPKPAACTP